MVTICDKELAAAIKSFDGVLYRALNPTASRVEQRLADQTVKNAVRRLVRAGKDVEMQRAFEKGIEAFAAMPMVRERNVTSGPGFWTGD